MILPFSNIKPHHRNLAGGKGLVLGLLSQAGFSVPKGFVVSTKAFDLFQTKEFDEQFLADLRRAFDELGVERVAVRSSASAEDSRSASWAGQLDTYLNVSWSGLASAIRQCWESIQALRVNRYIKKQDLDGSDLKMAVVVQKMVDSTISGILFTKHPVSGNSNRFLIEASYGLGETVVRGEIVPDRYLVNKKTRSILRTIGEKERMVVWEDGENRMKSVAKSQRIQSALHDHEIATLIELGERIESHFGSPQDIEWCFHDGKFHIVQARPITTTTKRKRTASSGKFSLKNKTALIARGVGASPGQAAGAVKIITDITQLDNILDGDVLVARRTTPEYTEAFFRAAAIVTENGGVVSHAAIVSRELGIPSVVGVKRILQKMKDGEKVTVDGTSGKIYRGNIILNQPERKPFQDTFFFPEKTGNDLEDTVTAIVSGSNDANELWPLAPGQLMPYIESDQALDMYQKVFQLVRKGWSDKRIAALFEHPANIKMFLLNTGIIGMKSANVFEKRATIKDQITFTEKMLQLAKVLSHGHEDFILSGNFLWSQRQARKFIKQSTWKQTGPDDATTAAINALSVSLLALNWSLYWDYFPETGHELHGPYPVSGFDENSTMIVKDYFHLDGGDIWETTKNIPYRNIRLAQIYDTDKFLINFGNRLVGGEGVHNHLTHFHLSVDGELVTSPTQIRKIASRLARAATRQTAYVRSLEPLELVRKGAMISYFSRKKFYSRFSKHWYPEAVIEKTIATYGTQFIDENKQAKPLTPEAKRILWDPRNAIFPWLQ